MMGDTFLEKKYDKALGYEIEKEGGAVGDEFFLNFGAPQRVWFWYSASTSSGDL